MRGSILALLATAIGSGILALPYVARKSGVINVGLLLFLGAVLAYVSMTNLIRFSYIAKKDNYARLVEHVLGDKVGIFLHCMFIVYAFGCNVTY